MQKFAPVVLRIGLSLVFLWFGLQQVQQASMWVSYLPDWTSVLPVSPTSFVLLNGWFEIVFGVLLISGLFIRIASLLLGLHLLGIAFSLGYSAIAIRDFGLAVATLSVFIHGVDTWSMDGFLSKKEMKSIFD